MLTPGEHRPVQARIRAYVETIGCRIVSREEAEQRRGFDTDVLPSLRHTFLRFLLHELRAAKTRVYDGNCTILQGSHE